MANVLRSISVLQRKTLVPSLSNIKKLHCCSITCTVSPVSNKCIIENLKSSKLPSVIRHSNTSSRAGRLYGVRCYGGHYDNWRDIHYEDLVALINSGDIQLIDVREPRELQEQGTFPNAINIPLSCLTESLKLDDAVFIERYRISKPHFHDTNIVFVGYGPVKSNTALEIAHKMGFKKQLPEALRSSPHTFKALYGEEKPDYDDENIVFACLLGMRSLRAMQVAHELGYTKARQYSGGYQEWHEKQTHS